MRFCFLLEVQVIIIYNTGISLRSFTHAVVKTILYLFVTHASPYKYSGITNISITKLPEF